MAGDTDYKEWLKEYVRDFNEKQGRKRSCFNKKRIQEK